MRLTRTARLLRSLALSLSALAAAPAHAAPPDGKIVIHYSRCDNAYDGWGVHLWKNPGIPLPGIEWQNPMLPSGKTDFGVFWQADLAEFGKSATVNYIIHKGDTKEQGGRDMKFDGNTTREIWVLGGDRKTYSSLDDAQKARAEKPCS